MSGVLERRVAHSLVGLAGVLATGTDEIEFLQEISEHCARTLGAGAAGVLLADPRGSLAVASVSEQCLELHVLLADRDGPALECFHGGEPVSWDRLDRAPSRFTALADRSGYASAWAAPIRAHAQPVGVVAVFHRRRPPDPEHGRLTQAFADMAGLCIPHTATRPRAEVLRERLRALVENHIVVEQAKGVLAALRGGDVDEAFTALRAWARHHRTRVLDVARAVLDRTPEVADLTRRPG
ncbi:GAF and ANTAR domain-containing protein [Saccharothrix mutabilis subsp. mutabilis]|uniref:GAF and ANTAR domain-containing protein n=1 Tax=Saccharothrix mutabilis subsp. mutabilis TaxID=66855 RepID=A0ABN0UHZ6_9PSEU